MENPELAKKLGEWSYMSQKEQDEYLLIYGTRKQRKAIKERRNAREQAQEQIKDE
jgi:predicted Fe-S protein YdhL (DUF1289 family)